MNETTKGEDNRQLHTIEFYQIFTNLCEVFMDSLTCLNHYTTQYSGSKETIKYWNLC